MGKSTLKIARYCPFGDAGFLQFFRVVSIDYGKSRIWYGGYGVEANAGAPN